MRFNGRNIIYESFFYLLHFVLFSSVVSEVTCGGLLLTPRMQLLDN